MPKSLVVALHGDDMLRAMTLRNCETGEERMIETSFLFLCLGGVPNTQWAKEVGIVRDEEGYLVTGPDLRKFSTPGETWKLNREPYYLETSMPGVFAAGDVRHGSINVSRRLWAKGPWRSPSCTVTSHRDNRMVPPDQDHSGSPLSPLKGRNGHARQRGVY